MRVGRPPRRNLSCARKPAAGNISVAAIQPIEQNYFTVMKARVQFGTSNRMPRLRAGELDKARNNENQVCTETRAE